MTTYISKRRRAHAQIDRTQSMSLMQAIARVKECSSEKFNASIEVAMILGINSKRPEESVRGASVLPHGTGRVVRVAVMTQGENIQKALDAGADLAGFTDLAERIARDAEQGIYAFDVLIASPDAMGQMGKLARVLGPRGLMPNPKTGTVTPDVAKAVKNVKAGQVAYRNDKAGVLHALVGKKSFSDEALKDNIHALIADIKRLKPSTSKGIFLRKVVLSSTMGPGIQVSVSEF